MEGSELKSREMWLKAAPFALALLCLLNYLAYFHHPLTFKLLPESEGDAEDAELMVGINSSPAHFDRVDSVLMTWGKHLKVKFFSCAEHARLHKHVTGDSRIPCNEYPPVMSLAYTLLKMSENKKVHWFMMCDDDSYVNVAGLSTFMEKLKQGGIKHMDSYYFGAVGTGREKERHLLGLNGAGYALSGPCVMISAGAMQRLATILPDCMKEPAERIHSDVQLGRCFLQLNISVGLPGFTSEELSRLFRHFYTQASHLDGSVIMPFISSTVPEVLPLEEDPAPLTLHSIKDRLLMLRVHAQLFHGARPVQRESAGKSPGPCYHNPQLLKVLTTCPGMSFSPYATDSDVGKHSDDRVRLNDSCSKSAPECSPLNPFVQLAPLPKMDIGWIDVAYIITLHPEYPNVQHLAELLGNYSLKVEIFLAVDGIARNLTSKFLTPGEIGLRQSYKEIFLDSMNKGYRTVAIFEDDALLHRDFAKHMANLFSCSRCTCQLHSSTKCTPGLLMLGSAIYDNPWHQAIDDEMKQNNHSFCTNFIPKMFGTFAVIYNVDLFPSLIHWLDRQMRFPYDWIFNYAAQEGYILRLAIPQVAIANLDRPSSVKKRIHEGNCNAMLARFQLHRWHREDYDGYTPKLNGC